MFDVSKAFDLSKKFALLDTFLKSKNYCTAEIFRKTYKFDLNPSCMAL